jgi:hypothetical protein
MFFVIAFLSATSAFIIMGLKEYIQEELGIKDDDLIYRHVPTTVHRRFYLEGVSGLYGTVEFSPADLTMTPRVTGPFCTWHDLTPTPRGFDQDGKALGWVHVFMKDNKRVEEPCSLVTQLSERELEMRLESGAREVMIRERTRGRAEATAGANAS